MSNIVRADRPYEYISFDDFHRLSPWLANQRHGIWRSLQSRRWRAMLDLLDAFRQRDPDTWHHCQRVREHAVNLAVQLKLSSQEVLSIRVSAMVHDIGKMAVSDAILMKTDRLSDDEFCSIRMHTEIGERLIHPLMPDPEVLAGIRHHHERMDGQGYPDKLMSTHIPLISRIISIADVFDALTQIRPYRRHQLTQMEAIEVIEAQTAGHLDPDLVYQFSRLIRSNADTVIEMPAVRIDSAKT
jgi:putative nucleotidyltransferase with HDIG domain